MEAQTALVRADGTVELNSVAKVDMDFALVVNPRNTERDNALRLNETLDKFCFFKLRVLVVNVLDRKQHFPYGLQVL